jgi:hypothetical protein
MCDGSALLGVRHVPRFLLAAPIMELPCAAPLWIRPGRLVSLGWAGAPATLRAAAARVRGGGEDKGRRFALAGTDQSPLS